ncbi:hypothetical protein [Levilactobacillus bambusae]|uniref:Membrane-binding protein n=1 Tax=Levilactobacillus bambusae TaxID=2024736 RepID=A0A2V1MYH1_9LACO|nr:hypothetical protein [Levilactobacillus bambusae]PWG00019.1 hypothetical protein DCM90_03515 [Levilactobacillus bambusae]
MKSKGLAVIAWLSVGLIIALGIFSLAPTFHGVTDLSLNQHRITYHGEVAKNKFNGAGQLTFKNHDAYQGNFKDGRFDGQGRFTSHEGWQFTGTFKKGVPVGSGQLQTEDNKQVSGHFKRERFVNEG